MQPRPLRLRRVVHFSLSRGSVLGAVGFRVSHPSPWEAPALPGERLLQSLGQQSKQAACLLPSLEGFSGSHVCSGSSPLDGDGSCIYLLQTGGEDPEVQVPSLWLERGR